MQVRNHFRTHPEHPSLVRRAPVCYCAGTLEGGKNVRAWTLQGLCVLLMMGVGQPRTVQADTEKTLKRSIDVVTVPGKLLRALDKTPLEKLGCFAAPSGGSDGAVRPALLEPIPCQVDERTTAGEWVLTQGPEANPQDGDGQLSPQDELVMLSADAGIQVDKPEFPAPVELWLELMVRDSQEGGVAWIYLARFSGKAPRATQDYVRFDPKAGSVDTPVYSLGFSQQAPLVFDRVVLKESGGGSGKNPIDRMKVRLDAKVWDTIPIQKSEEDYTSALMGYIDGPVRVLRRTRNRLVLFWKIPSPSAVQDNFFYPHYFEFPILVTLPLDLDAFLSEATLRISVDLNGQEARSLVNSRNRGPLVLDGKKSDEEGKLDTRPYSWSVVSGLTSQAPAGWFNRLTVGANTPIEPHLYFRDDQTLPDPPEGMVGHFGDVGYEVRNLKGLKKGTHRLTSVLYWMPRYVPGMEYSYLAIQDSPLQVTTSRSGGQVKP